MGVDQGPGLLAVLAEQRALEHVLALMREPLREAAAAVFPASGGQFACVGAGFVINDEVRLYPHQDFSGYPKMFTALNGVTGGGALRAAPATTPSLGMDTPLPHCALHAPGAMHVLHNRLYHGAAPREAGTDTDVCLRVVFYATLVPLVRSDVDHCRTRFEDDLPDPCPACYASDAVMQTGRWLCDLAATGPRYWAAIPCV